MFVCARLLCVCVHGVFPGGHENFRKMIDEAEPLGYPVVVKNARGHRGKAIRVFLFVVSPAVFATLPLNNLYSAGT